MTEAENDLWGEAWEQWAKEDVNARGFGLSIPKDTHIERVVFHGIPIASQSVEYARISVHYTDK